MCRLILVAPMCAAVSRGHRGWTFAQDAEQLHPRHRKQEVVGGTKYVAVTFDVLYSKILGARHTCPSLSHEVLSPILQRLSRGGPEPGPLSQLRTPPPFKVCPWVGDPIEPRYPPLELLQGISPGVVDGTFHMQDLTYTRKFHRLPLRSTGGPHRCEHHADDPSHSK